MADYDFRYFRYAKNRISNIDIFRKYRYIATALSYSKEKLNDEPPPLEPDTSDEGNMGNLTVEVPEESKKAEVEQSKFTVYRREFKIIGIVGPDTQKDRLSFVSLTTN